MLCVFILASSVICLTGCSGSPEKVIEDNVAGYIDAILAKDFNESKTYVSGEADSFERFGQDELETELLSKIIDRTSYEIESVDVATSVANVSVRFVMPYLEPLGEERITYEEFIAKIDDVTQTYERTILFSVTKTQYDEWLVAATSTEVLYNLFLSLDDGVVFAKFSLEEAETAVRNYIDTIARGDFNTAAAINMNYNNDVIYSSLRDRNASVDYQVEGFYEASGVYYSRLNYDIEFTNVTDDQVTITINGYAPDLQEAMDAMVADEASMAQLYADMMESEIRGRYTDDNFLNMMMVAFCPFIEQASLVPFNKTVVVAENAVGELEVDTGSGLSTFYNISPDPETVDDLMLDGLDILLEEERITEEEYELLTEYVEEISNEES